MEEIIVLSVGHCLRIVGLRDPVREEEGVFSRIVVEVAEDVHRAEALGAEEELCREIRLTEFHAQAGPALLAQFALQSFDHLRAHTLSPVLWVNCEI